MQSNAEVPNTEVLPGQTIRTLPLLAGEKSRANGAHQTLYACGTIRLPFKSGHSNSAIQIQRWSSELSHGFASINVSQLT